MNLTKCRLEVSFSSGGPKDLDPDYCSKLPKKSLFRRAEERFGKYLLVQLPAISRTSEGAPLEDSLS